MGKVKRIELWWLLYVTSLPERDVRSIRPLDFCWKVYTRNICWCGQVGRCVGLITLPPSCADRVEVSEPQTPRTLRDSTGIGRRKNERDIISRRLLILLGIPCNCLAKTHVKYNPKNMKYNIIITLKFRLIMIIYLTIYSRWVSTESVWQHIHWLVHNLRIHCSKTQKLNLLMICVQYMHNWCC